MLNVSSLFREWKVLRQGMKSVEPVTTKEFDLSEISQASDYLKENHGRGSVWLRLGIPDMSMPVCTLYLPDPRNADEYCSTFLTDTTLSWTQTRLISLLAA